MATFLTELWGSIFTAGPTPTLLVATNASFAALQVLFLALLIATYSVHFVILSCLTAGLWWSINWFAKEIRAAQEKEEAAKRIRDARKEKSKAPAGNEGEAMDSGDDTEVDTEVEEKALPGQRAQPPKHYASSAGQAAQGIAQGERDTTPIQVSSGPAGTNTTGASARLQPMGDDAMKKRRSLGESVGELSTDSEWEKVSESSDR